MPYNNIRSILKVTLHLWLLNFWALVTVHRSTHDSWISFCPEMDKLRGKLHSSVHQKQILAVTIHPPQWSS